MSGWPGARIRERGIEGRGRGRERSRAISEKTKRNIPLLLPLPRTSPSRRAPRWPEQGPSRAGPRGRSGRSRRTRGRGPAGSSRRRRKRPSIDRQKLDEVFSSKVQRVQLRLDPSFRRKRPASPSFTLRCLLLLFLASCSLVTQSALSQSRPRPHFSAHD